MDSIGIEPAGAAAARAVSEDLRLLGDVRILPEGWYEVDADFGGASGGTVRLSTFYEGGIVFIDQAWKVVACS
jgi:hypothetical protein